MYISTNPTGVKVTKRKPVTNRYKVPARLWKSFGENGQRVFNETFMTTFKKTKQSNITHPEQVKLPKAHWETICWNFSCYAAWSSKNI